MDLEARWVSATSALSSTTAVPTAKTTAAVPTAPAATAVATSASTAATASERRRRQGKRHTQRARDEAPNELVVHRKFLPG